MNHDLDYDDEEDAAESAISCAECGASFYEDAPCCPVCGYYPEATSVTHWQIMPQWWIVIGILGMISTIIACFLF